MIVDTTTSPPQRPALDEAGARLVLILLMGTTEANDDQPLITTNKQIIQINYTQEGYYYENLTRV